MPQPKRSNRGSGGKLLDTWHYEHKGIGGEDSRLRVESKKVEVELRLVKEFSGDTPPMAVQEVYFRVVCKAADIDLTGSDVEALRLEMWGLLDEKYEVSWSDYYLVTVEHRRPYEGMGEGFALGYETVERGIAWDGTLLLRKYQHLRGRVTEPWPGEFRDKQGHVSACIPASEANKAALKEFCGRIDALREALVDLIRPSNIEATLANLSNLALLPPQPLALAEPDSDDEEDESGTFDCELEPAE